MRIYHITYKKENGKELPEALHIMIPENHIVRCEREDDNIVEVEASLEEPIVNKSTSSTYSMIQEVEIIQNQGDGTAPTVLGTLLEVSDVFKRLNNKYKTPKTFYLNVKRILYIKPISAEDLDVGSVVTYINSVFTLETYYTTKTIFDLLVIFQNIPGATGGSGGGDSVNTTVVTGNGGTTYGVSPNRTILLITTDSAVRVPDDYTYNPLNGQLVFDSNIDTGTIIQVVYKIS